ncbi:MAG: M3 family metallopeptidase, partial [Promethearchaeota archaeon]
EITRALVERPELVENSALEEYRHTLEKTREKGKYLLSERDEQLILEKDLYGIDSWSFLHDRLRSTRKYRIAIDGEEKEMVYSELATISDSSPNREFRKVAAESYYKGVVEDRLTYSTAMKCIFGDHLNQVKLRGYPSVLTQSLLYNDISENVLYELIESVKKNTHIIRKFLKLRAKAMGLAKLTGYDISPIKIAPISKRQSNIPWSDARRLVIESFTNFDEEAGKFVASLFEKRKIDASVRPNKSASGFCYYFPGLRTSYIMMSYGGAFVDIATLAHESGHGLHSYYASKNHTWINFDPGNCLAETGSNFGEMLLFDKLLAESDDDTRFLVLDKALSGLYLMVFYMLNDYLFEHSVFTAMQNKETINAEKLDALWLTARNEVFGDSVEWLPGMEQWWVVPNHHFMPRFRFYNYPYSFAHLLALVLYQLYKEEGASFVPKMKRILSAGGSESPKILLSEIGLDITDSKFWEFGFKQAETYLDEFEVIVKNL